MNHPRRRRYDTTLVLLGVGLALMLPVTGLLAWLPDSKTDPASDLTLVPSPALTVETLAVEPSRGFGRRHIYTGRVEPFRSSDLGFERSGLLREVLVREGNVVALGQVVARLDKTLLEARRAELVAATHSAEADLDLAESTLKRYLGSVHQGAVTRQALDEARAAARAAAAALELARSRIASLDLDIQKTELRAPFDGTIISRLADEGEVLPTGQPVLRIQEDATPEIRVGLAGPVADVLELGSEYRLTWQGRPLVARLRTILPVRGGGARTVDALFTPVQPSADPVPGLRSGELLELELTRWVDQPGVWLPFDALTEASRGLWGAYAVEPLPSGSQEMVDLCSSKFTGCTGRLAVRPLQLLYQEGDRVYVRGALAGGERLVATGLHRVVPGQLVRVSASRDHQVAAHVSGGDGEEQR